MIFFYECGEAGDTFHLPQGSFVFRMYEFGWSDHRREYCLLFVLYNVEAPVGQQVQQALDVYIGI